MVGDNSLRPGEQLLLGNLGTATGGTLCRITIMLVGWDHLPGRPILVAVPAMLALLVVSWVRNWRRGRRAERQSGEVARHAASRRVTVPCPRCGAPFVLSVGHLDVGHELDVEEWACDCDLTEDEFEDMGDAAVAAAEAAGRAAGDPNEGAHGG